MNDTQDTRVQDENVHYACTWFFCTKDLLESAKIWKDALHSRENNQKERIGNASVIKFECSDFTGQDLASISVKDYVHSNEHILCHICGNSQSLSLQVLSSRRIAGAQ